MKKTRSFFEKCVEMLQVKPEECIYIGDGGSNELEASKAFGMNAMQAAWYLKEGTFQPSKRKEEFVPLEEGKVKMYVCGPTVYNLIHIGNARPMIVFDTVRRYMEHKGYEVNYVSNFTDVDDKIIKKAAEEGVDSSVISERYIEECKKDMEALNVKPATTHPLATKEIDGMVDMIFLQRMVQYITEQEVFRVMVSFPIKIWMIFREETAPY